MAIRKIREMGDDVLTKACKEVKDITFRTKVLIDDMFDTMYESGGVGLAAPQVGILKRVFVIETEETGVLEFINPEILETLGKQVGQEGCLSVPERYGDVERPAMVKVKAFDRYGKEFEMVLKKLAARAVCHENDHLDGVLYIDREIKTE